MSHPRGHRQIWDDYSSEGEDEEQDNGGSRPWYEADRPAFPPLRDATGANSVASGSSAPLGRYVPGPAMLPTSAAEAPRRSLLATIATRPVLGEAGTIPEIADIPRQWWGLPLNTNALDLLDHLNGPYSDLLAQGQTTTAALREVLWTTMEIPKSACRNRQVTRGTPLDIAPWSTNFWAELSQAARPLVSQGTFRELRAAIAGDRSHAILTAERENLARVFNQVRTYWPPTRERAQLVDRMLNSDSVWTSPAIEANQCWQMSMEWTRGSVATWVSFISALNERTARYSAEHPNQAGPEWIAARQGLRNAYNAFPIIKRGERCDACHDRYACTLVTRTDQGGWSGLLEGCLFCRDEHMSLECSRWGTVYSGAIITQWNAPDPQYDREE